MSYKVLIEDLDKEYSVIKELINSDLEQIKVNCSKEQKDIESDHLSIYGRDIIGYYLSVQFNIGRLISTDRMRTILKALQDN